MAPSSLRWSRLPFVVRLLAITGLALLVAGLALLLAFTGREAGHAREDLAAELSGELRTLPPALAEILVIGDFATLQQTLDQHVRRAQVVRIRYRDVAGATVEGAGRPPPREAPAWITRLLRLEDVTGETAVEVGGRSYGTLEVTLTAQLAANRAWAGILDHLAILLLAVGVDLAGIWLVLRAGLRPLHALDRAAGALAEGNLLARVEPQGSPEFQNTISAFNHMADAVREARESLSRGRDHLELLASVFENALEGIIITDAEARFVEVNPAFCHITGYGRAEVLGQKPSLLRSGRHDQDFFAGMWRSLLQRGFWRGEIWNRRKNGEVYPELLTVAAVPASENRPARYIGIFSDISTLKAQQRELEQMANFDALTRLPNRMLLSDRLQVAMAQARRSSEILAVCYLDLDGFKPINDSYGHDAGDRLLIEMGARLKGAIRASDTAARLGGDEFVLLLQGLADRAEAEHTVGRILKVVSQSYRFEDRMVSISASAGVAFFPQEGVDADTLLRQADQAMYQAKQEGRNRFHVFDPAHDLRARTRRETIARIAQAISAGELCLYYQPKVDMRRGKVVGAEALVRWRHPLRGMLQPAEFLPVIDDPELAARLGEWVIAEALHQTEAWRRRGLDLRVSVNVSGQHMQRADFAHRLRALLSQVPGLPPDRFEIEVLETAALGDIQGVSAIMEACRRLGVSLALDDFGTGYSSLTYLKRLPANVLKIDQSFVRNMLRDREDLAIVDGIVGLTEAFQRTVIAEGVESVDHGVMLLNLGCELAQGYGIAHPMAPEEVPDWVASYRPFPAWQALAGRGALRDDLSLLNAEVDHRRWVEDLLTYARPGDPAGPGLPELAVDRCRFGRWYATQGRVLYGALPDFRAIAADHQRLHEVGRKMAEMGAAGEWERARAAQDELLAASAALLGHLQQIRATEPGAAPKDGSALAVPERILEG